MHVRILALLATALVLLAGCVGDPEPASDPAPSTSTPVTPAGVRVGPAWSFTTIDDEVIDRDSPERNASVLFFMATWCSSCRSKAPLLAEIADEFEGRGVAMLSIDFDPSETRGDLEGWKAQYGHDWPHGIDTGQKVQRALRVTTQSSVVVLDANGNVVKHFSYGQANGPELRVAIEKALSAA